MYQYFFKLLHSDESCSYSYFCFCFTWNFLISIAGKDPTANSNVFNFILTMQWIRSLFCNHLQGVEYDTRPVVSLHSNVKNGPVWCTLTTETAKC